ncbi:MAG: dockerin type I repeat-containing protein [Ruminococcus sp.]|nr:dockerin type I repeat-containing protein [Ruminococcus sp.]
MKKTTGLFTGIATLALIACISAVPEQTNAALMNPSALSDFPAVTTVTTTGYDDVTTVPGIPLSGTFSITFSVVDIDAASVDGLECELYCCETGEVVDTWNTSESEIHTVSGLKYNFEPQGEPASYIGTITYKMRIKNLPENYVYYFGRTKEDSKVYAKYTYDFYDGLNPRMDVIGKTMLVDLKKDATRTTLPPVTTTAYDRTRETTTAPSIPLSGTFDLGICFDFTGGRRGYVKDLECELYQCETGEVIASWNTSDLKGSPYKTIEGLRYNFVPTENGGYKGTITYKVRVKDLPEGYALYPSGSRDIEQVTFGNYLLNKTKLSYTYYMQDLNYVPSTETTTKVNNAPKLTETTVAPVTTTAPSIRLSGEYSLKLDFALTNGRSGYVKDLDCELYQCETGEVVASWNTTDELRKVINGLKYNFVPAEGGGYKSTVTYKIRVKNLPESYVYHSTQGKEITQVFGMYLAEFNQGLDRSFSVYFEDKNPLVTTTYKVIHDPIITTTTEAVKTETLYGDANLDEKVTIADAVAILQHIGNRDKYGLSAQGMINGDVDGAAGITANDALVIQKVDANLIKQEELPLS